MKKFLVVGLFVCVMVNSLGAQNVVLLPSAGVQSTISTIEGSSPALSTSRQSQSGFSGGIRAYLDSKKGHSFFIGLSAVNHGISVTTFDGMGSTSKMSSSNRSPRLEFGYQVITKPLYPASATQEEVRQDNGTFRKGLFFQLQPMVGFGYNFAGNNGGLGRSSGGLTSLKDIYTGGRNFSLLTGANLYFGRSEKQLFFISFMKNWNFGNYTAQGNLSTQINGTNYQNTVKSFGTGTSFSIGVPIRIGRRR